MERGATAAVRAKRAPTIDLTNQGDDAGAMEGRDHADGGPKRHDCILRRKIGIFTGDCMRLHVIGLAHTQTTRAYENCAFTSNVRGFCRMMKSLGHEVLLYASEDNDAPCDELVTCITKKEQASLCGVTGPENVGLARYDARAPHWQLFNNRVSTALRERSMPGDFLCLISGESAPVAAVFPHLVRVEFSAGYMGVLPYTHRVFPSYAWMHCVYQRWSHPEPWPIGRADDCVIPHYFNPDDFPFVDKKQDYLMFIGRLNRDKGYQIAIDVARAVGIKLVVAGAGDPMPPDVDYRGLVGIEERGRLMSEARAVFVPSQYMEPFGKVAVEALLCGTPIITSDWGAFPEICHQGLVGYRCRPPRQYHDAAHACIAGKISARDCRQYAIGKYSEAVIAEMYQSYFDRLQMRPHAHAEIRV